MRDAWFLTEVGPPPDLRLGSRIRHRGSRQVCAHGGRFAMGLNPTETLAMRRPDYDPYVEVTKMLTEFRTALAAS